MFYFLQSYGQPAIFRTSERCGEAVETFPLFFDLVGLQKSATFFVFSPYPTVELLDLFFLGRLVGDFFVIPAF